MLIKRFTRRSGTKAEINVNFTKFHDHIRNGTLVGKAECLKVIQEYKVFEEISWSNLKDFVRNHKAKSILSGTYR